MRTVKNSSLWAPRIIGTISSLCIVSATFVAAVSSASIVGCSHAWEEYDPRITGEGGGTGSSSSTGAGGSGGSGGGSNAKCGGTSVVVNDFEQNDLDELWDLNNWGGATLDAIGGELVGKLPMNSPDGAGAYLISKYFYDFRGDFVSVEVARTAEVMAETWTAFSVGPNENSYIELFQEGSTLNFGMQSGGNYNKFLTIPYDSMAHRFWQIRESAGRVYYETSPDGENWTAQTDVPVPPALSLQYSRMVMATGCNPNQANPGEAHFDRLNRGGKPLQNYCPMNSLTDDFNDGMLGDQWLRSWEGQPGMLAAEGGQFVVKYPPNLQGYAGLTSSYAFDLRGSEAVAEVPGTPASSVQAHIAMTLNGPGDNDVDMFVEEGTLKLGAKTNGNYQDLATMPYSAVDHRWWRIRETGNTLYWETSPDGKAWTQRLERTPPPVPVNVVDLEFHAGVWSPQAMPGECRIDNLNLPPP